MRRVRLTISLSATLALAACAAKHSSTNQPTIDKPADPLATKSATDEAPVPQSDIRPAPQPETNSDAVLASLVGAWRLVTINGQDTAQRAPLLPMPPAISFAADASISGFAGVNRFTGRLDKSRLADGVFKTSPLAMTRMAGPSDAMQLEGEFATALSKATAFKLDAGALTLLVGGTPVATFERAK